MCHVRGLSVFSQGVAVGPFYIPLLKPVCLTAASSLGTENKHLPMMKNIPDYRLWGGKEGMGQELGLEENRGLLNSRRLPRS